jgi:hypothetical protein
MALISINHEHWVPIVDESAPRGYLELLVVVPPRANPKNLA